MCVNVYGVFLNITHLKLIQFILKYFPTFDVILVLKSFHVNKTFTSMPTTINLLIALSLHPICSNYEGIASYIHYWDDLEQCQ